MGRKSVPVMTFPPECCGVCCFYHVFDDGNVCMVAPPVISNSNDELLWLRGAPADAEDPPCRFFKARMHA